MTDFKQYNLPPQESQTNTLGFVETPNVLGQNKEIVFDKSTSIGPGFCGTYTPEITILADVTVAETHEAQYMRIGQMCIVSGVFRLDCADLVTASIYWTLPFVTHFDLETDFVVQLSGSATSGSGVPTSAHVVPYIAGGKSYASLIYNAPDTTNRYFSWILMYRII